MNRENTVVTKSTKSATGTITNTVSTSTTALLKQKMKDYIKVYKQIQEKNKELGVLREELNKLQKEVIPLLKKKNLYNKSIKIDNCYVTMTQSRDMDGLTYKFLEDCLQHYTGEKEEAHEICNFIKSKRNYRTHEQLKVELTSSEEN